MVTHNYRGHIITLEKRGYYTFDGAGKNRLAYSLKMAKRMIDYIVDEMVAAMLTETYATFAKGDKVRATMNTLSLCAGQEYTVFKAFKINREPWEYDYYVSNARGELFYVKNGHIGLEGVN